MHVVTISWVRNECDIIETFVRHHALIADRMIIVVHRSSDNTKEILEQLKQEGLPLDIRTDESIVHDQCNAQNALLEELYASNTPDWIIPLDADEYVISLDDKSVRDHLASMSTDTPYSIPWRTYVPTINDNASEHNHLRRIRHRRSREDPQWSKACFPGSLPIALTFGSHTVTSKKTGLGLPLSPAQNLALAHFPVRSVEQIAVKVLGGWLSHVADPAFTQGFGYQWKAIFDQFKKGKFIYQWKAIFDRFKKGTFITPHELTRIAYDYASSKQWKELPEAVTGEAHDIQSNVPDPLHIIEDPISSSLNVRYTRSPAEPMQVLLETAELLAIYHSQSTRQK